MSWGRSGSLPLFFSPSLFGQGSLVSGHSPLVISMEGRPCASYTFSAYAYFSTFASILEKFIGALFSIKKRKGHLHSLLFMVVITVVWSKLYTSRATILNELMHDQRDSCFPCLILTRELEPRCNLLLLTKYVANDGSVGQKSINFGLNHKYHYQDTFLRVEGKA